MPRATQTIPPRRSAGPEKAVTLALSLAQAERAIQAFASGQVDAIVDADGNAYLLRAAQEQLRQSERRLQAVMESIADVITVVNRRGEILSQTNAVSRVLGHEAGELVGKNIVELIHPEDWPAVHSAFLGVSESLHENATVQFRHRAGDGTWRAIEAAMGLLRDDLAASVVFSLRPITRPLQRPAPEDGNGRVLSHGRRMPLTEVLLDLADLEGEMWNDSMKSAMETTRRRHESETQRRKRPVILGNGGPLNARLTLGSIDAHDAARNVLDLCHREIAAANVEALLYLRADESIVQADWARLLELMCNLVRNAVDCATPGSTVSIASHNNVPGKFSFELAADGIAMESALWPRTLDSFPPCDASTQQLHDGIRKRLNIARRLAEAQGGTLHASSEGPGKGTTFYLTLNTAPRSSLAPAIVPLDEPAVPSQPADSLSVLLVEGSGDAVLAGQMERCGHSVLVAPDLPAAIVLAENCRFDLLIIDVTRPENSGYELMEQLHRTRPSLAGIALGGFGMSSEIYQSRAAGFSAHLVQPVTLESLQAEMQTVVVIRRGDSA